MDESAVLSVRFDVPKRYYLRRTLGMLRMGHPDPTFRAVDRVVAMALWTPEGPVTAELSHQPEQVDAQPGGSVPP